MSINKFTLGLGIIQHPFDIGGHVSITQVTHVPAPGGTRMNLVVDHAAIATLGNMNIPSKIPYQSINVPPPAPITIVPAPTHIPPAPLPGPLSAIGRVAVPRSSVGPTSYVPDIQPQTYSADSLPAPFETIHHDFKVEAVPFYNFWTDDETTNDREDRGDRNLDDVPRFIKVSWVTAPVLTGQTRLGPSDVTKRQTRPVKFGTEAEKPFTVSIKGITFAPDHLQPQNFSEILSHLANGHIFPGVIHATIEMPLHNTGLDSHMVHAQTDSFHHIDEDAFLTHPSTKGVSIHELRSNVHQLTNGVLGAAKMSNIPVSRHGSLDRDQMFSNRFSMSPHPFNSGELQLHGVGSTEDSLPGSIISMTSRTAYSSEGEKPDHVLDMVKNVQRPAPQTNMKQIARIKASFVHPAIGGAIQQKKTNLMSQPHHAESVIAIAQMLPKLEVLNQSGILDQHRKLDMPSFPAPPGMLPLEYVGYVLEKYHQNKSGAFELVEIIQLPSNDYDSYIDCKIKYGDVYRYRVRSIMRWTRMADIGSLKKRLLTQGISASTKGLSPYESSYFAGEWSPEWGYASVLDTLPPDPPDELQVRAESSRKRISVTFKLPDNPQRDIYIMRLFRKLQDRDGRDLTGWTQVLEHNAVDRKLDFAPQNVLYYDSELVDYFQVNGTRYVYTAQCISRHHEFSAFSEQIGVRLNSEFNLHGEFPVEFVSCRGVKPEHFGAFSVYPHRTFRSEIIAVPPPKEPTKPEQPVLFTLAGRNVDGSKAMDDALYFVRVESLDTGEKQDIRLNLSYNNQKSQTNMLEVGIYVPTHSVDTEREEASPIYGEDSRVGQTGDKGRASEPIDKPLPPGAF